MFSFADRLYPDLLLYLFEGRWIPNAEAIETMLLAEGRQSSSVWEMRAVSKGKDFEGGLMTPGSRWVREGGAKEGNLACYAACQERSFGVQSHVLEGM